MYIYVFTFICAWVLLYFLSICIIRLSSSLSVVLFVVNQTNDLFTPSIIYYFPILCFCINRPFSQLGQRNAVHGVLTRVTMLRQQQAKFIQILLSILLPLKQPRTMTMWNSVDRLGVKRKANSERKDESMFARMEISLTLSLMLPNQNRV